MGTERRGRSKRVGAAGSLARRLTRFGFVALLVIGCSAPSKPNSRPLTTEEQAILNVGLAYREASRALWRGPSSVKEIQPYLKKYGDPDKMLISPNDGQPYHIVWGIVPSRPTKSGQDQRFLLYEQTGKDGKRYALDCMLKVHHLSDEEFNRLRGSS